MTSDVFMAKGHLRERGAEVSIVEHGRLGWVVLQTCFWKLMLFRSVWHNITCHLRHGVGILPTSEVERWTEVAGSKCLVLIGVSISVAIAIVRKMCGDVSLG